MAVISGVYEEVVVGKETYYVTFTTIVDQDGYFQECPQHPGKKCAIKLLFSIEEILKGEARESVPLTDEVKKEFERVIRRRLVAEGEMVTPILQCIGWAP